MRFSGETALVTGAGRGLGAEVARQLAREGARVVLVARTGSETEAVARSIRDTGGEARAVCADIASETEVARMEQEAREAFGTVGILVNNAAVFRGGRVEEMTLADWEYQLGANLTGPFLCCRQLLPGMRSRGRGAIVNISSSAARFPFAGYGAYAASKAGIEGFTATLAEELRGSGIHANALRLGLMNTAEVRQRVSLDPGAMMQPAEVARVVLFLASREATGFRGTTLDLFGQHL